MTEFWVSQKNYWCDICKVWMTDNPSTRATHEKGVKHQELVAKKLREMRQKADSEKRQQSLAEASLDSIEREAARQYARDKAEADRHQSSTLGSWDPDPNSGYLYNAVHRYYYDKQSGMYYGGDPPAWTVTPKIPDEALCNIPRDATNAGGEPRTAWPATTAASRTSSAASTAASAKGQPRRVVRINATNPLSGIGGHAMPSTGTVGALKGVAGAATAAAATAAAANKRKREVVTEAKAPKKALTKEEEEAIAKREAARARVQKRTMASFGLA